MDRLLNLVAAMAVRGLPQMEQIAVLDRAEFAPKEIARVIGTTSNTVRVALVGIRRSAGLGRRKRHVAGAREAQDG